MRRYALLGDPVDHSISPDMHRAAFRTWGLDAEYIARTVTAEQVGPAMRDTGLAGGNVTLPYKLVAAETLARPTRAVRATGACNCWWWAADGELAGDNTDVGGLGLALERLGFESDSARVLLLGAGGAAHAAVHVLLEGGVSAVEILNRTPGRARTLRDQVGAGSVRVVDGPDLGAPYDLVLNATSLGLSSADPLPLELDRGGFRLACDLVYAPGETRWVRHARSLGIPAGDGLEMLVGQAALSLRRWFPGRTPPVDAMRAAGAEALARRAPRAAERGTSGR